jgi:hypothetical protein
MMKKKTGVTTIGAATLLRFVGGVTELLIGTMESPQVWRPSIEGS